jgi:uncharacterized protein involved in exopolysaccharide biosynthesis
MRLRDIDVEEVGKSFFEHCTNPKALYITLIERWWVVAVCALVGVICGAGIIKTSEKIFSSDGKLLVYQKLPTFMDDSTRIVDPKAYDSLFATHVQLISSSMIVEKAVEDFQLDKLDELDAIHAKHRELGNKSVGDLIREDLKASRAGSGDSAGAFVIALEYSHKSAKECPLIIEAILETYKKYLSSSTLDDQNKALNLLTSVRARVQSEIERKSRRYRDFLKTAPGVWDRDTLNNSHQLRVEKFEVELSELEIEQENVASRIEILEQKTHPITGTPLTDLERLALVDDIHLPRLEILISVQGEKMAEIFQGNYPERQEVASARYDDLLTRLVELNATASNLGENHPKYIDMKADIKLLEAEIVKREKVNDSQKRPSELTPKDLVSAYEVLLCEEAKDLEKEIEFVKAQIVSEVNAAKDLYDFSIEAQQLKDDYEQSKELASVLIDKMQKQTLLSQFGSYVAEIVQRPHKGQLTWPKKPVILVLCTLVGFFIGSFLALSLDLIQFSPLRNLFGFLPNWIIRGDMRPTDGHPAT